MKSIRTEIARLRKRALAKRAEREHRCVCQLVFVAGAPTPEQQAVIKCNTMCKADHSAGGFSIIEAPLPPEDFKLRLS